MMIRTAVRPAALSRHIAAVQQARFASSLVYLEHKGGKLNDNSLSAVTAAKQVDGNVGRFPARVRTELTIRLLEY
jgi:electron transfer flavoprotein alpha subunit